MCTYVRPVGPNIHGRYIRVHTPYFVLMRTFGQNIRRSLPRTHQSPHFLPSPCFLFLFDRHSVVMALTLLKP